MHLTSSWVFLFFPSFFNVNILLQKEQRDTQTHAIHNTNPNPATILFLFRKTDSIYFSLQQQQRHTVVSAITAYPTPCEASSRFDQGHGRINDFEACKRYGLLSHALHKHALQPSSPTVRSHKTYNRQNELSTMPLRATSRRSGKSDFASDFPRSRRLIGRKPSFVLMPSALVHQKSIFTGEMSLS